MKTEDTKPLEQFCECRVCRGTGMTTTPRCQAIVAVYTIRTQQCNVPAKPGSKYCGLHRNQEGKA